MKNSKLILFILAGIALVIYGVIKLIFQYVHHHSETSDHKQAHHGHAHHHQASPAKPGHVKEHRKVYHCNNCNGPVYDTFRYCPHCGVRLQ